MKSLVVRNETTGATVASQASEATSAWARFKGLMWQRALTPEAGLLIRPCASVHSFFMRFAIDVVFVDRADTVVKIVSSLKPYRAALGGKGAHSALELEAGAAEGRVTVGDRLIFEPRELTS